MQFDLRHGDCLEVMAGLPDASVDMILCDLPYGTTACKWDTVIPFEPLWAQYRRIAKRNAAIVLTAAMPFTAALVMSNPSEFRYEWIWEKSKATSFLRAAKMPLRAHESVVVFGAEQYPRYFAQKVAGKPYNKGVRRSESIESHGYVHGVPIINSHGMRWPRSVQYFVTAEREGRLHPTQKPVALMEYLIRTYTQEGETVLDNCAGSFTTGVACLNTGRRFIGIERDDGYFRIGSERMAKRQAELDAAQPRLVA